MPRADRMTMTVEMLHVDVFLSLFVCVCVNVVGKQQKPIYLFRREN